MSTHTHTPGPWKVTVSIDGAVYILGGDRNFARVFNEWQSEANQQANARLIAAAPRMLKALKWAETMILQHCRNEDGQTPDVTPIRQAIDEAEGRK